jgi:hypothetical protein
MNRIVLCMLPLLMVTAGCLSSTDDEDYKPFTAGRWREMIKENENRLKPEEQRPMQGLGNPLRLFIGTIAEGISWIHDLATGHDFLDEAKKLFAPNPDHRRSGIIYLSDRSPGRHDPYAKQYLTMARSDADPAVRSMAIRALNRARDKRAIPIFLAALDERNESVRLEGAKGLANIPDPSAVAPLIRHLDFADENVDVRVACADALRMYRTPEVAQALVRALRDRNFGIAWQARKSLQLMTGKDFRYDTAAWLTYLSGTNKPFG